MSLPVPAHAIPQSVAFSISMNDNVIALTQRDRQEIWAAAHLAILHIPLNHASRQVDEEVVFLAAKGANEGRFHQFSRRNTIVSVNNVKTIAIVSITTARPLG